MEEEGKFEAQLTGPSPIQGERWMNRFVRRMADGSLEYQDSGPSWYSRGWEKARTKKIDDLFWPGARSV